MSTADEIASFGHLLDATGHGRWADLEAQISDMVEPCEARGLETWSEGFRFSILMDTVGTYCELEYPFALIELWQQVEEAEESTLATWNEMEDLRAMPLNLSAGQRLHVVLGSPAASALGAYLGGYEGPFWTAPPRINEGDLLLTILDVAPAMALCLERAQTNRTTARQVLRVQDEDAVDFAEDGLVPKAALDRFLDGAALPMRPHTVSRRRAHQIMDALTHERRESTPLASLFPGTDRPSCNDRWSGIHAQALAGSDLTCRCCEVRFGRAGRSWYRSPRTPRPPRPLTRAPHELPVSAALARNRLRVLPPADARNQNRRSRHDPLRPAARLSALPSASRSSHCVRNDAGRTVRARNDRRVCARRH